MNNLSCSRKDENVAISSDGISIKFSLEGKGTPTIVFVYGWAGKRSDWTNVMKEIKAPICCINSDQTATDIELARKYAQSFNAKIVRGIAAFVNIC